MGKTGLKYNDDCGWYAVVSGRIVQDEISGQYNDAFDALAAVMDANREPEAPGSWEYRQ